MSHRSRKYILLLIVLALVLILCVAVAQSRRRANAGGDTSELCPVDTTAEPSANDKGGADTSDSAELTDEQTDPVTDPYITVSVEEFYADYRPASGYRDSYYRSLHGLMSGSIDEQDQAPTFSEVRPTEDGVYLKNTSAIYSEDGHAYTVLDANGDIAFTVYEGGGYVTLEEVAAYVFAFGDIPANYTSDKKGTPSSSPWGEYLRLNHSAFSGNTSRYPYEPELPEISGCGGSLYYYELDIGTSGTDCDPGYTAYPYNDGNRITRGAARIVYSRYDADHNKIIEPEEKHLFYTNNHYNDFREYLNYEGGWGEIFGNVTGGGTISSKIHYNPTPYIPVKCADFRARGTKLVWFTFPPMYSYVGINRIINYM